MRHDSRVLDNGGPDAADPDLLIDFRNVSLRRNGRTLVGPLDWAVELDERWVIVGPNGAGKTSLLRIAAAAEHPSSGVAFVLGERLGRVDVSELRARVGLSSSALAERVPGDERVRDLVVSAGYAVLGRWRERYEAVDYHRAIDMLESLGAEHLANRTYGTLSEGERKRVLIARALMTDPELLLLDEPAAGLDLGGREELVARLADLAADPDAPALVLVTHHVEEIPPGFQPLPAAVGGPGGCRGLASRRADRREPVHRVWPGDHAGGGRRAIFRPTASQPSSPSETVMNSPREPLVPPPTPRPAATVMLVRDPDAGSASGLAVFLMRRHAAMDFAAGVMVFPGGGVDDRDRDADLGRLGAWAGPPPQWWAQRFGIEPDLAEALVCAAARETFEESGVLFAGPVDQDHSAPNSIVSDASVYGDARRALADRTLSFADFLQREKLVLRSDLLRPWANWVTPEAELTRRYDTYFFVGALPEGQRADGENTESDRAGWVLPADAIADFAAGRNFLLPPTWTQLDSLAGHTVADVLAVERQIVPVQPQLARNGDNWEIEFFDSDRYNQARRSGGSTGWPL